jgi:hypothetical protein
MPIPAFWSGAFHAFTEKGDEIGTIEEYNGTAGKSIKIIPHQPTLAKGVVAQYPLFKAG